MKTTKYQHFIRIIDLLLRGLFSHQIISFMSSGASDIVRILERAALRRRDRAMVSCTHEGKYIRGIHSRPKEGQTKGPVLRELGRMDQTVGELFGRSLVFFLTRSQ